MAAVCLQHKSTGSDNPEGLSKEELGRLVASRWTGEKTDSKPEVSDDVKDIDHTGEISKDGNEEDSDGYASEFDGDDEYDKNDSNNLNYDDNDDDHSDDEYTPEDHEDSSSSRPDSDDESVKLGMQHHSTTVHNSVYVLCYHIRLATYPFHFMVY